MRIEDPERISSAPDGRPSERQPRWRRDFPIDWPLDEHRSRRDFTKLLGLTSLAFVVGQAWIVALSRLRRARGRLPVHEVARLDEVPVGRAKLFYYPTSEDPCVLVRLAANQFVAFGQKCTHLSCPVIPKPAEGRFFCPCHEGSFDLRTGEPLAGPPRRPLPRVQIEVRDGHIYATGWKEGLT